MNSRPGSHELFRRARLALEPLETRETPAGAVTLSLLSNTISLIGDGNVAGNEVRVTALATDRFRLDGLNGTSFVINKVNVGNTVDTGNLPAGVPAFAFPDNGTTALKATFLGGADRFEYDGTAINPTPPPANLLPPVGFGDVTLSMGAGNDTVILRQFIARNVTVNSTLPTGVVTDNDAITILAGGTYDFDNNLIAETYLGGIRSNLTINGQSGNDTITLAARVGVNVTATLRDAGDAVVILGGSRIGGAVTVTETPTTVLGTNVFSITENSQIAKWVTLTNTGNAVNATIANSMIGGNVTLTSGSGLGGSTFNFSNSSIGGIASLTGGTLLDTFSGQNLTIGKNLLLTMGNGGNGLGDTLTGSIIAGNFTATYGTGNDLLTVQNSTIAGNVAVTGGAGQDRFIGTNLGIGKAMTLTMGDGGNGAGDTLTNVNVAAGLTINYGGITGDDILDIQNSAISTSVTINAGAGNDRLSVQNSSVGLNFAYTGGAGGNGGGLNPDLVTGVSVGGTFRITYGAGNEELQFTNSNIIGAATIGGGNGNDLLALNGVNFLATLAVTGGSGIDTINASNLSVIGTTALTTSGGNDVVNLTQSGRYQGRVTINTGGAGPDQDTLNIEAAALSEITFLGGLSIATGPPLDNTTIGTQAGKVVVLNGFFYPEAANLDDNPVFGNNLFVL